MKKARVYKSCFSEYLYMFSDHMKASHHWNSSYECNIASFDRYCADVFPYAHGITQEMIDSWCKRRDTETNISCHTRQCSIVAFVKYLRMKGIADVCEPDRPKKGRSSYIPHAFTDTELREFFQACDSIEYKSGRRGKTNKLKRLNIPVIFRMLYSTGMRTNEVRLLARKDIDLENGVVGIRQTKGEQQRYIVLHPTLLNILRRYDTIVDKICPEREYFFPSPRGGFLTNAWLKDAFREMWDASNSSYATAYELRHNYAIVNINRWQDMGFAMYDSLLYLSKSMGHSSIESTRAYYAIVPTLSDTINEKSATDTDWILPDV